MKSKAALSVALVMLASACGSPPPQETTPAPTAAPPSSTETTETAEPAPAAEIMVPPGEAPTLSVTGTPAVTGGHVAISIMNRGAAAAELSTRLAIEVERDGAFVPVERSGLTLRYDCAQEAPTCVTLAPGAELIPPEWLGTWGDMQCVCTRCGPAEPGTYRFVVTTCNGVHVVEGTPFTLAP